MRRNKSREAEVNCTLYVILASNNNSMQMPFMATGGIAEVLNDDLPISFLAMSCNLIRHDDTQCSSGGGDGGGDG